MLDTIPAVREGIRMTVRLDPLLRYIHSLAPLPESVGDGELLGRFVHHRDQGAFAELVRRHGPMTIGPCRRTNAANDASLRVATNRANNSPSV